MRIERAIVLVVLLLSAPAAFAQRSFIYTGNMDATLRRGQSQTFTVEVSTSNFTHTGVTVITVNAADGLSLGQTVIEPGSFTCVPDVRLNKCAGDATISPTQKIRITQPITVHPTAFSSPQSWRIQIGALSLGSQTLGSITIPDAQPKVVVVSAPSPMIATTTETLEVADRLLLKNIGTGPARVVLVGGTASESFLFLEYEGSACTSKLCQFPMAENEVSEVKIFRNTHEPGLYRGQLTVTGNGVEGTIVVPVRLLVGSRPTGNPQPRPVANRVDTSARPGEPNPVRSIDFTNTGSGNVTGLLGADAPWLIPQDETVEIAPGETKRLGYTVDLASVPADVGAAVGSLILRYLLPASGAQGTRMETLSSPGTAASTVTVVTTLASPVVVEAIPPRGRETPLILTGIGRVVGSVGLFLSDLSLFSRLGRTIADLDLYFTPLGGGPAKKTTIRAVVPPGVTRFGDIAGTVFDANQQIGTLQLRTRSVGTFPPGTVGATATILNVSNVAGTYGTVIPTQVFDDDQVFLTGLRKDATGHTNFYVQEMSGSPVQVKLDFYAPSGTVVGSTTVDVAPWAATQVLSVPDGTVSAVLSRTAGDGTFNAYATPVDRASGDTWAVVEGPAHGFPQVIPIAGAVRGANNTYFRTDLAIMNTNQEPVAGKLRFYNRTGETLVRDLTLQARETKVFEDVTTTLFGIATDHLGWMEYDPGFTFKGVTIAVRIYTTAAGSRATYGTAVPTLFREIGGNMTPPLKRGAFESARQFGGVDDSVVGSQRGATFRTNLGLVEIDGKPATVRVTLHHSIPEGKASRIINASKTYELAPRQLLLIGNIAAAILGEGRAQLGDLYSMQVEVEAVGGDGAVVPFVTSVDNGTGDSIFRLQ